MEGFAMDRRQVVERVRDYLSSAGVTATTLEETSAFGDMGLTSLDLIVILLDVQREYGLRDDWFADLRFPKTVGELATLIESVAQSDTECAR
jgi:acyl carrier protein